MDLVKLADEGAKWLTNLPSETIFVQKVFINFRFENFIHHEANAYNADRPNNEIHENWC